MRKLPKWDDLQDYSYLDSTLLEDIGITAVRLQHRCGAQIMLMPCEDDNRVFTIAFPTLPDNSKGMFHILEHSVLCGSRRYPVKDPFLQMAKGSLSTYLNALTYPDRTVFPVSSRNEEDLTNLMDVYLDAVFEPKLLEDPRIFMQEGWHFAPEGPEGPLEIQGVVYSEMQGALASPEDLLENAVNASLFPDTPYRHISGGDPREIPTLSYEELCEYYRQNYHPGRAFIYLYGDLDYEERLTHLAKSYLNAAEPMAACPEDRSRRIQPPLSSRPDLDQRYPSRETGDDLDYYALSFVMPDDLTPLEWEALKVLDQALCDGQGGDIRESVIHADLGLSFESLLDDDQSQGYWSFRMNRARAGSMAEFERLLRDCFLRLSEEGPDPERILSAVLSREFSYREADYGGYSKGLVYALRILRKVFTEPEHCLQDLKLSGLFPELKDAVSTSFYRDLIRRCLLENDQFSRVHLAPSADLEAEQTEIRTGKLAAAWEAMGPAERSRILAKAQALEAWQQAEDSPEALRTIPRLPRTAIRREAYAHSTKVTPWAFGKTSLITHPIRTQGILYVKLGFELTGLGFDRLKLLPLLTMLIWALDTKDLSYSRLYTRIGILTGGIGQRIALEEHRPDRDRRVYLIARVKLLENQLDKGLELLRKVLTETLYDDASRLRELLEENTVGAREALIQYANYAIRMRMQARLEPENALGEYWYGLEGYRLLQQLTEELESGSTRLCQALSDLAGAVFTRQHLAFADITADEELLGEETLKVLAREIDAFPEGEAEEPHPLSVPPINGRTEALEIPGTVQFVGMAGSLGRVDPDLEGACRVLNVILGYDYLWNEVRVRGGAYDCRAGITRLGSLILTSFRDPQLQRTLEAYRAIPEYVRSFQADEAEMTQYILGTFSGLDMPMSPSDLGDFELSCYLRGMDRDYRQRIRDSILSLDATKVREVAAYIAKALEDPVIAVAGNRTALSKERDLFEEWISLSAQGAVGEEEI